MTSDTDIERNMPEFWVVQDVSNGTYSTVYAGKLSGATGPASAPVARTRMAKKEERYRLANHRPVLFEGRRGQFIRLPNGHEC